MPNRPTTGSPDDRAERRASVARARRRQQARGEGIRVIREDEENPKPPEAPLPVRILNHWWDRLVDAIWSGSLASQSGQYASHQTTRDYICNTLGWGLWGMIFPILSVVAAQLVGIRQAGMFSMAMVVGQLLLFVANYGLLTYQVSDIEEMQSFNDYIIHRVICCFAMLVAGFVFVRVRGYDSEMASICMGVFLFRAFDGLSDVFEGRLQQKDKLYLAGISMALRDGLAIIAFSVVLFITRNLAPACFALAIAEIITFVVLTLPLTLLETDRSYPASSRAVRELFQMGFPLFLALFLFNLIDSVPRFAIEGMLTYEDQLFFNAMYFPARFIVMVAGLAYKPQLVRLASIWADPDKHRRFDVLMLSILGVIVLLTGLVVLFMATVGIPLLGVLYNADFEQFRPLALIMVAMGGVCASIDFLYQIITVLREQRSVTKLYLIAFVFAVPITVLLVRFAGLAGAVVDSLVVMAILLLLLITEYLSIKRRLES